MHDANVDRARRAGLYCRPVQETVLDSWHWFSALNTKPPVRAGLPTPGLDPSRERTALHAWHHHHRKDRRPSCPAPADGPLSRGKSIGRCGPRDSLRARALLVGGAAVAEGRNIRSV
jgi:hypothetical protein